MAGKLKANPMANSNRDEFAEGVKKRLAARVGYLCSRPDCQASTAGPCVAPDRPFNVGTACHIAAAAPGGPRYDASMTPEQRVAIENGIWLCRTHGKEVDDDEVKYPVDLLKKWNQEAEERARARLGKAPMTTPAAGPLVDVSQAERYGHKMCAALDDGRSVPLAYIFDPAVNKPTSFVGLSYVVRFLIAKRPDAGAVLLCKIEATVYSAGPVPVSQPRKYAFPVAVNPFVVALRPPEDGRPRPCPAEFYFQDDFARGEAFVPLLLADDAPEVIDVRFNASQPGIYRVALDVTAARGSDRQTYRVLYQEDVIFK